MKSGKPPALYAVVFDVPRHPVVYALKDSDGYYWSLNVQRTFSRYHPSSWIKGKDRPIRVSSIGIAERGYFEREINERNAHRKRYAHRS